MARVRISTSLGIVEGLLGTSLDSHRNSHQKPDLQIFKGVPYAKPPIGDLRWQPPQPLTPWSGVLETLDYGHRAPQLDNPMMKFMDGPSEPSPQSENCLSLNIWAPLGDKTLKPVMVWLHGGAFSHGSASQATYDGQYLARRGNVLVITLNYRLGMLGFLNLNEITMGKIPSSGNEGLLDQIAALEWIKTEISHFGGDPNNVTLFGESAGAMSIAALLTIEKAEGLFHKAILQSGSGHAAISQERSQIISGKLLALLDIKPEDTDALMNISAEELVAVQGKFHQLTGNSTIPKPPFQPVIDGDILKQMPITSIRQGLGHKIPLMVGTTLDEWKLIAIGDPAYDDISKEALLSYLSKSEFSNKQSLIKAYQDYLQSNGVTPTYGEVKTAIATDRVFRIPANILLEAQGQYHADVYNYICDWQSPIFNNILRATHGIELGFLFGTFDKIQSDFFGEGIEAESFSNTLMDRWLKFARNGTPNLNDNEDQIWSAYEPIKRATMMLGKRTHMTTTPNESCRRFWSGHKENLKQDQKQNNLKITLELTFSHERDMHCPAFDSD